MSRFLRPISLATRRGFASRTLSVTISPTPNPRTFVYSANLGSLPTRVVHEISQHGSVSDTHRISDSSVAVTFFQTESIGEPDREEVRSEIMSLLNLHASEPQAISVDITDSRIHHDPTTPAGRVAKVIEDRIKPGVNADGGDVELVELTKDGVAIIRMSGACNGCPSSDATLKNAIEKTLLHFCSGDVTQVEQAPSSLPLIKSEDILPAMSAGTLDLPSVISHDHVGVELESPLSNSDMPVVSLFAKRIDDKLVNRVKFASTITIPAISSSIDVLVKCQDCGCKKRLEDVSQLVEDAKLRQPTTNRVAVVICPACAVIVERQ